MSKTSKNHSLSSPTSKVIRKKNSVHWPLLRTNLAKLTHTMRLFLKIYLNLMLQTTILKQDIWTISPESLKVHNNFTLHSLSNLDWDTGNLLWSTFDNTWFYIRHSSTPHVNFCKFPQTFFIWKIAFILQPSSGIYQNLSTISLSSPISNKIVWTMSICFYHGLIYQHWNTTKCSLKFYLSATRHTS